MIASLRAQHRRTFHVLTVLLPALLTSALVMRDPPMPASPRPSPAGELVRSYGAVWKHYGVEVQLRRSGGQRLLTFAGREVNEPDMLVYLAPQTEDIGSATLLGRYAREAAFPLPANASGKSKLLLYSGARQRVLDEGTLELAP